MIGLNISAGLDSVVAIYILIPFILIPQLLLSGAIVPFDKLNPAISSRENVPLVGNLMTSRWSFEALAVEQFKNNRYEKIFYENDKKLSHFAYLTAYVIPTLKSELDVCQRNIFKGENVKTTANYFEILKNEIPTLQQEAGFKSFPLLSALNKNQLNDSIVRNTKLFLDSLSRNFSKQMNAISYKRDAAYEKLRKEKLREISKNQGSNKLLFLGKTTGNSQGLFIADQNGQPKLMVYVDEKGDPKIQTFNEKGQVKDFLVTETK